MTGPHLFIGLCLWACASTAAAHSALDPATGGTAALRWSFEPLVIAAMLLSLGLYVAGFARLRQRTRLGRVHRLYSAAAFVAGWLALGVAFVSPLDGLGAWLFSAHMVQHEILMLVAAPLLVLGRPLGVWLWALPAAARTRIGRGVQARSVRGAWRWLTLPATAWGLHLVALWGWHIPRAFEAALVHPALHAVQHTSFLVSALLFWWTVLAPRAGHAGRGFAMLSLFTTMAHTGALGALLTLAPAPWYASYFESASAFGLDALEDQQLGGLVMWVPGGLAYLIAALAVAASWMASRNTATPGRDALPNP
ncbi:cytochrome c oxidase assembly factor CtaG [Variovorax sp. PBL-H6]|uniref:cytochrome c oxidase assembly protein n=1 Tax=Variovorax sp. PBL-H6 TaxID=434009 RepID=UPI0013172490|nr:cytochrome c oxidase assembly protein [Variovorax sp. PBL-H6]VTU39452.1 cytochrome c oxidase assembly factor CtaG [Variovorax sp. PBL-H6]